MKNSTIIINATALGSRMNGIGVYLLALLRELATLRTDTRFIIYVTKKARGHLKNLRFPASMVLRWAPAFMAPDYGFAGHLFRLLYANYLSLRHPSAFFFNGSQLEAMLFRKRQVITVHDIIPLLVPRNHARQHWYFKSLLPCALRTAAAIITPSHMAKKHLIVAFGLEGSKIEVIHHGSEHALDGSEVAPTRKIGDYLLFIGRASAHKNLEGVINGFCKLAGMLPHRLVVAGIAEKDHAPHCAPRADAVEYRGYVNSGEKLALYRSASLLVFISHHEGFGLPPLEAMANACPVVASHSSCIPEICGDAAYYVDPADAESIAEGIRRVATDKELRADLVQRGLERAKMFSWRKSAERHLAVFEEALFRSDRIPRGEYVLTTKEKSENADLQTTGVRYRR